MGKERLIRFFLVGITALLILGAIRVLASSPSRLESQMRILPNFPIEENIKELEIENFPLFSNLKKVLGEKKKTEELNQEGEPITEPVQNIQSQTQDLIESIKKLPEDQIKAVRKQIYKEFCESFKVDE